MNNIHYKNPLVKIIDSTDPLIGYNIWKASKNSVVKSVSGGVLIGDEFTKEMDYYKDIMKMNMQYNNIPYFVLEIDGSLLFRDILYNINKTSQWATSLRLTHSVLDKKDINNYVVCKDYEGIKEWEDAFDSYYSAIQNEDDTDKNRITMPYSLMSKYWLGANFKTLINLLNMLRIKMPMLYTIYGKLIENELNSRLEIKVQELYSSELDSGINKYFSPIGDFKEDCTKVGDYYYIRQNMSLILYSQFIRQADTDVTGLWSELVHSNTEEFKHKVFTGDTLLKVTYLAHKDRLYKTIKNRVCWFSQSNGSEDDPHYWSKFLNAFIGGISTDEFKQLLPCKFSNGKLIDCKYKEDVKFRDKGLQKGYIPCSILNHSQEYADARYNDCPNKLNKLYKDLTTDLVSGKVPYTYKINAWTSELIIKTSINIIELSDITGKINSELDYIRDMYSKYQDEGMKEQGIQSFPEYDAFGIDDDKTCVLKGYFLDVISKYFNSIGIDSYLISFGGDIFSHNVSGKVKIDNTNFFVDLCGDMSIFTSGNTSKRGNHIIGCDTSGFSTVIVEWSPESRIDNALVDALATKYYAKEQNFVNDITSKISRNNIHYLNFTESGQLNDNVYCASPFFNPVQIEIRDKMVSKFNNAFRPDLTENSEKYNSDHSNNDLVYNVVDDNINGITNSKYLVFPSLTTDLGTLFEVGHAIAENKPIIRYVENSDEYIIEFIKFSNNINPNAKYLFDCSKKLDAISIGIVSKFTDKNNIYYTLNGQPDNIMISINYNHIELVDNEYKLIERSLDDRDQ